MEVVWKDAVFVYESSMVPEDLRIVDKLVAHFQKSYLAPTTLFRISRTLDQAAVEIDKFKSNTCGSAFSLAVINLNLFGTAQELSFLLQRGVLGDPRTIFVASLRYMSAEAYTLAKSKVQKECSIPSGAPSCIDAYTTANLEDAAKRQAELVEAYIEEMEERAKARRDASRVFMISPALNLLQQSNTTYYGVRGKSSIFRVPDFASGLHRI